MDDEELIRQRVAELVQTCGKSLSQLEKETGVSRTTISRYLGGTTIPGFPALCAVIIAAGGNVAVVVGQEMPSAVHASDRELSLLRSDLAYERRQKERWTWGFIIMVLFFVCVLLYDLFNPNRGWIQYAAQMGNYITPGFSAVFGGGSTLI